MFTCYNYNTLQRNLALTMLNWIKRHDNNFTLNFTDYILMIQTTPIYNSLFTSIHPLQFTTILPFLSVLSLKITRGISKQ